MKSVNIQNLKVGGEIISTEAEVPSELSDLTKDTSGYKNLDALKVIAGNGIVFTENGDFCEISTTGATEIYTNINVDTFDEESPYADFKWRGIISSIPNLSDNDVCEIIFSQEDASSGNYAQVNNNESGNIYIYSKENVSITIPTIIIIKGGA